MQKYLFSYFIKEGEPSESRKLINPEVQYDGSTFKYGTKLIPQSMQPKDYGTIMTKEFNKETNITRYVVKNNQDVFFIDSFGLENKNHVRFHGLKDIKWVDTLLHDDIIKREIGNKVYYIKDGVNILFEREINAKQIRSVKTESKLDNKNIFMTIDIETVLINNVQVPYLICGYSNGEYIFSYADDLTPEAIVKMFKEFIYKLIQFNDVKYVYAHNLSGFDGILLLNHLIVEKNTKVKPVIFNNKLMSINFKFQYTMGKSKRKLVRK